jgi:hypothetical protein
VIYKSGECYIQAIDINSEDMVFEERFDFQEKEELDTQIDNFLVILKKAEMPTI